jgi:hypothetical protein
MGHSIDFTGERVKLTERVKLRLRKREGKDKGKGYEKERREGYE